MKIIVALAFLLGSISTAKTEEAPAKETRKPANETFTFSDGTKVESLATGYSTTVFQISPKNGPGCYAVTSGSGTAIACH